MATTKTPTKATAPAETEKVQRMRVTYTDRLDEDHSIEFNPEDFGLICLMEKETGEVFSGQVRQLLYMGYIRAGHPFGVGEDNFIEWAEAITGTEQVWIDRPTRRAARTQPAE